MYSMSQSRSNVFVRDRLVDGANAQAQRSRGQVGKCLANLALRGATIESGKSDAGDADARENRGLVHALVAESERSAERDDREERQAEPEDRATPAEARGSRGRRQIRCVFYSSCQVRIPRRRDCSVEFTYLSRSAAPDNAACAAANRATGTRNGEQLT